jgi:hypothetical protein
MSYPELQMFDSSSIAAGRYDANSHALEIQFNEGKIYKYVDVPRDTWLGLCRADSKGGYFQSQIRDIFVHQSNDKSSTQVNRPEEPPPLKVKKKKYDFYDLDFWEVQEFAINAMSENNWERAAVSWERLEVLIKLKIKCHRAMAYCKNNRAVCLWWQGERERAVDLMCYLHKYADENWSYPEDADAGEFAQTYQNKELMENYLKNENILTKPKFELTFFRDCFFNSSIPDDALEDTEGSNTNQRSSIRITPAEIQHQVSRPRQSDGCAGVIVIGLVTVASLYFI